MSKAPADPRASLERSIKLARAAIEDADRIIAESKRVLEESRHLRHHAWRRPDER